MSIEINMENGGPSSHNIAFSINGSRKFFTGIMFVLKLILAVAVLTILMITSVSNRSFIEELNNGYVEDDQLIFIRAWHYFCSRPEGRAIKGPSNTSILWALSLPPDAVILTEKLRCLGECRAKAATLWTSTARRLESDFCACGMHRHVAALMVAAVFTIIFAFLSLVLFGVSRDVYCLECFNIIVLIVWGFGLAIYFFFELSDADLIRFASHTDSPILYFALNCNHMVVACFACLLVVVCSIEFVPPDLLVTNRLWMRLVHSTTSDEASSGQIDSSPIHHPSSSRETAYNYDPPDQQERENVQPDTGGFLALNPNGKDDVEAIEFYLEMRFFQSGIHQVRKEKIERNDKTSRKANSSHL